LGNKEKQEKTLPATAVRFCAVFLNIMDYVAIEQSTVTRGMPICHSLEGREGGIQLPLATPWVCP